MPVLELPIQILLAQQAILFERHVTWTVDRHFPTVDGPRQPADLDRPAPLRRVQTFPLEETPILHAGVIGRELLAEVAVLVAPDFRDHFAFVVQDRFFGAAGTIGVIWNRGDI